MKDLTAAKPIIERIKLIDERVKELGEQRDMLKQQIIELLDGDDTGAIDGKPVITYKTRITPRFDVTTFKKLQPDVYDRFTVVSESRAFVFVKGNDQ